MPPPSYHVVPSSGGWLVQREGATASREFADRGDAVREARRLASLDGGSLHIHGPDGSIHKERTQDLDPFPPIR